MSVRKISRQLKGTAANVRDEVFGFSLKGMIPPSWLSTMIWIRDVIPRGLGFADRSSHMTASVPLFIFLVATTGWWLTVLAGVYFFYSSFTVAIRFIPAVERRWPLSEDNWPFWTVKDGV